MREKLEKLLENSYAKYSGYKVACICLMADDREYFGVNVENASYGATICAERNAITNAVTAGCKKGDFKELHIMVDSDRIGTPCFMCRQVMVEFFDFDAKVYLYSKKDMQEYRISDLCPHPFTEDNL